MQRCWELMSCGFSREKGPIKRVHMQRLMLRSWLTQFERGQDPNLQGELPGRVGVAATDGLLVESLIPWGTSVWSQGFQLLGFGPLTFCRAICFTQSPLISVGIDLTHKETVS